jgi:hypothetical protein
MTHKREYKGRPAELENPRKQNMVLEERHFGILDHLARVLALPSRSHVLRWLIDWAMDHQSALVPSVRSGRAKRHSVPIPKE